MTLIRYIVWDLGMCILHLMSMEYDLVDGGLDTTHNSYIWLSMPWHEWHFESWMICVG